MTVETEDYSSQATPSSHASTHETGGSDVIDVTLVSGELADEQKSSWSKVSGKPTEFAPEDHGATHQTGGSDVIDVTQVSGELADEQKSSWSKVSGKPTVFAPGEHGATHQTGGSDVIDVTQVSGELADEQKSSWSKVSGKPTVFVPEDHGATHQTGGSDVIDVTQVSGELADEQKSSWSKVSDKPTSFTPSAHHATHEKTGDDRVIGVILADGSVSLTGDWNIGDGRKLIADIIRARDAAGLGIYDKDGKGVFVHDGGVITTAHQSSCMVYRASTQIIPTDTPSKIAFGSKLFDINSEFDNTTHYQFTAKTAGIYSVFLHAIFNTPFVDKSQMYVAVYKNGTSWHEGRLSQSSGITKNGGAAAVIGQLAVNDTIQGYVYQKTGSNRNLLGAAVNTSMGITKIS